MLQHILPRFQRGYILSTYLKLKYSFRYHNSLRAHRTSWRPSNAKSMLPQEQADNALASADLTGASTPPPAPKRKVPHDAFSELMSPKRRKSPDSSNARPRPHPTTAKMVPSAPSLNATLGRSALNAYIDAPASFPTSRVLSYDDDFVVIRDAYPKASVHLLLLPRSSRHTALHPFDAFADATFLAAVRDAVAPIVALVASELRRLHGPASRTDATRAAALTAEPPPAALPPGRDWTKDVLVGVHAHPSMSSLHVHVLSRDRYSDCLKHRKHYNSFATPFLVPLTDFPLAEDDERRQPGRQGYLASELWCWRCGKGFGKSFVRLKEHLKEEFEEWRKE